MTDGVFNLGPSAVSNMLSMIVIMIGIIAQDHHRSKYGATQPFIHEEKKKSPSDKEGLLPIGYGESAIHRRARIPFILAAA